MIGLVVFVALAMFVGLRDGVRWYMGRRRGGGRHRCLVNDWLGIEGLEDLDGHLQVNTFHLRTFWSGVCNCLHLQKGRIILNGGILFISSKEEGKTRDRSSEGALLCRLHEKRCMIDDEIPRKNLPIWKRGDLSPIRRNGNNARISPKHAIIQVRMR